MCNGVGDFGAPTGIGARGTIYVCITPIDKRTGNGSLGCISDPYDGRLVCIGARDVGRACLVGENEYVRKRSCAFGSTTQRCHPNRCIIRDSDGRCCDLLIGGPLEGLCPQDLAEFCREGHGGSKRGSCGAPCTGYGEFCPCIGAGMCRHYGQDR